MPGVFGAPSLVLGPKYGPLVADWLWDRVNGRHAEELAVQERGS